MKHGIVKLLGKQSIHANWSLRGSLCSLQFSWKFEDLTVRQHWNVMQEGRIWAPGRWELTGGCLGSPGSPGAGRSLGTASSRCRSGHPNCIWEHERVGANQHGAVLCSCSAKGQCVAGRRQRLPRRNFKALPWHAGMVRGNPSGVESWKGGLPWEG